MRPDLRPFTLLLAPLLLASALLFGCEPGDNGSKTCTLEYRINHCVTVDGKPEIPAGLTVVRERGTVRDTLGKLFGGRCFGEADGRYRLLAYRGDTLVAALPYREIGSSDGCHADARTDDIDL